MAWNAEAVCDGIRAGERARWCVEHAGLTEDAARQRVMGEFPAVFSSWNPEALCDGHSAEARARWCVENRGLSVEAAQGQVMAEFPAAFRAPAAEPAGAQCAGQPGPPAAAAARRAWDDEVSCDGRRAAERAQWRVDNAGLSLEAARARVMGEFPQSFRADWDPELDCDGHRAEARARWCMENCGLDYEQAKERVMREFPAQFGGAPAAHGGSAALGAPSSAALALVPMAPADPALLVWADEFDYVGPPDPAKWGYDIGGHGWGNGELQYYTDRPENAWVSDGALRIRALHGQWEDKEFTSARLVTKGRADWLYGRVEVRLKIPTARGSWAAAWMLPTEMSFGKWPMSGEIDIMEHVGHDVGKVHGTVHTERFNHMKSTQVGRVVPVAVAEWHTYAVEWSESGISFMLDGQQYHRFEKQGDGGWEAWPFDQRFHILLNLAVGGSWGGQQGVDKDAFFGEGQVMEVQWVRVYRLR